MIGKFNRFIDYFCSHPPTDRRNYFFPIVHARANISHVGSGETNSEYVKMYNIWKSN